MLSDEPSSEGIVGHDQLFAGFVDAAVGDHTGPQQRVADALGELGRRLAGKGQSEDLLRAYGPSAHQPYDTGSHHRRLARSCSGNDHAGLERGGDRLQLLIRERDAERIDQVSGAVETSPQCRRHQSVNAHVITWRPAGWAGQLVRKGQ